MSDLQSYRTAVIDALEELTQSAAKTTYNPTYAMQLGQAAANVANAYATFVGAHQLVGESECL